ncbi:hydrolase/acyltransferase [Paenibacillus aurantius]|uniref:Hydrolase/acyltransferase n=1 Tax=Paenibacillus aurantius TaxID=2918900 RepID=A0AA96LBU8_9BACL|nr:hydrolase/acyltransferase [Paenibacillus aurantius]WJH35154.1 hydrolase/acyltransferase [Paenibacillus sp. CC-CFT747]WNQ10410.1 hydrolase/acyltransferase [Paenibacillus aurantius]
MAQMRYGLLQLGESLEFVEMPATHMYQLTALNRRLHKEIEKLTADRVPALPRMAAECDNLEVIDQVYPVTNGLEYINRLEEAFAAIPEKEYPLVSLLTEIRALQAQLEQWYEEEAELS